MISGYNIASPPQNKPWQVLQSIVSGGIVQVVHQALDGGTIWCGAAELLNGKAYVLVGTGTTADVAGGTGGDEQSLASNYLLLGQGGGLALVINLPQRIALALSNHEP